MDSTNTTRMEINEQLSESEVDGNKELYLA